MKIKQTLPKRAVPNDSYYLKKFAWFPTKMTNGEVIWLESYGCIYHFKMWTEYDYYFGGRSTGHSWVLDSKHRL